MSGFTKEEMLQLLKQLTPAELRVLKYEARGGHDCNTSTSLVQCCDVKRCAACHIPHLKQVHGEAAVHAYTKFAAAQSLTWQGRAYKQPLPVDKKPKVKKKAVSKPAPAPKQIKNTRDFAASIPDDQLDAMMAMMLELRNRK